MPDNLTPSQRRKAMKAVKGKNTSLERVVSAEFLARGWSFKRNVEALPGKPDFVFERPRVIVFVDGDFWHGWRFPQWRNALKPYWRQKIERTRKRDQANFRKLRRQGWKVMRFWGHQIDRDLNGVVDQVAQAIGRTSYKRKRSNNSAVAGNRRNSSRSRR